LPIPRYSKLEQLFHTLRAKKDERFGPAIERAVSGMAEELAGGDDKSAFKYLCNDLEDMALEGFVITPELYVQIEEAGRSVRAPERQWKVIASYVNRTSPK
jgi:hypothetical protein